MIFIRRFIVIFLVLALSSFANAQTSKSTKSHSASAASSAKGATPSPSSEGFIGVYFGPKATDDSTSVYYNLLRFLDSAKVSLYGSVHEIDMITVAQKLADRAEAGVDVQLVVESRWMSIPKDSAAINLLKRSKVRLIPDSKNSGLMHNKFFIADKERVWTGSTNLTEHCLLFNYNNGIWIENSKIAQNFLTEFFEEREGRFGKKGSGKSNTPFPTLTVGSARIGTYFSPDDDPMLHVVSLIDRAKSTIDIMCFVFSSEEISEALMAAKKRGVKVRVLFDNSFSSPGSIARWRYVPFNELSHAGITCKYDDESAKIHHKVIVVDGQEVLTGSFNLSNNAAKSNDENMVIINSSDIGSKFQAEFNRLWALFDGDPGAETLPDEEDFQNGGEQTPPAEDKD